jgi:hypothetical protein
MPIRGAGESVWRAHGKEAIQTLEDRVPAQNVRKKNYEVELLNLLSPCSI